MGRKRHQSIIFLFAAALSCPAAGQAHETANTPDLTHLPLGDGRISKAPKAGYIWACRVDPDAGGAFRDGPWIHGDTYDFTKKAVVSGQVKWPSRYAITVKDGRRVFTTNDLPSHATGTFPIPQSDDAYSYDRNPNHIQARISISSCPPTRKTRPRHPARRAQWAYCCPGRFCSMRWMRQAATPWPTKPRTPARAIRSQAASTTTTASRPAWMTNG